MLVSNFELTALATTAVPASTPSIILTASSPPNTTPDHSEPDSASTQPTLLSLPYDILHAVLLHIPNFSTLHSLLLTHPVFHDLYASHPVHITHRIASLTYPSHALKLLPFSRPNGLARQIRSYLNRATDGMFGQEDPTLPALHRTPKLGIAEARRLRYDSDRIVQRFVSWAIGIMEGREIVGYVDDDGVDSRSSGGRRVSYPLFDGSGIGGAVSAAEIERARKGVYDLLGLVGGFVWVPRTEEGNEEEGEVLFDCTEALKMPLEELFYILALCTYFSTWSFSNELIGQEGKCKLVKILQYRVYDDRKVVDRQEEWDLRYNVQYLRRVGLRDRWQGEVMEMVGVSKCERRGFTGGYRREMFEERTVKIRGGDGQLEEKTIMLLKPLLA